MQYCLVFIYKQRAACRSGGHGSRRRGTTPLQRVLIRKDGTDD